MNLHFDRELYNCRPDNARIADDQYHSLLVVGTRRHMYPLKELVDCQEIRFRHDGLVSGDERARLSPFFTIYGRRHDNGLEPITDAVDALSLLAVAGELARRHGLLVEVARTL